MALFQKKPLIADAQPLYTISATRTFLIIGLGNPGKSYDGTRHNIGFAALDNFALANDFPKWSQKKDLLCHVSANTLGGRRVVLCKPTTFMNLSGNAAQATQHFNRVYNPQTLAVYDELAVPFGQIRSRTGGSDAGHNGVKSLIEHIGDDFGRLRIGVGSPNSEGASPAKFVLAKFTKQEREKLPRILRETNSLITEFVFSAGLSADTRSVL